MKKNRKKREKTDYQTYHLSWQQWIQYTAESVALCAGINYLFYKSPAVFLFMLPVPVWYIRQRRRQQIILRKRRLQNQFKDALNAIQVGIASGYSLENTVREARKDLERIYSKEAEMTHEFAYMESQIRHGVSLEELLYDLGLRSGVEDIMNFSDVLIQSKKMGGNMRIVLQNCITSIEERLEVKKEIQAVLSSRKMEQKIMSVIPLGIILYMQLTSPGFLDVLYGNEMGICIMTACLALYLAAFQWGVRLTEIEV